MTDEQTNPNPDVEANPAPVDTANLGDESQTHEATEPTTPTEPESYTPEQIAEWKQGYETNATTQAEYTRQRQDFARLQENQDRLAQANSILMGREQERADPLVAIRRQLAQTYDEDQRYALEERKDAILMERAVQQAQQGALVSMDSRAAIGDADPRAIQELDRTMSEADKIRMYRREIQFRDGTLYDNLHSDKEAKDAEAAQAAQLNTPIGQGGYQGMPPGALQNRQAPTMNNITFGLLSADKRQSVLDAGIKIVNQRGEQVSLD